MEEGSVAHNHASSPLGQAAATHVEAQTLAADLIKQLSSGTVCYWWQLLGDEAKSLNWLLDISVADIEKMLYFVWPWRQFPNVGIRKVHVMCWVPLHHL